MRKLAGKVLAVWHIQQYLCLIPLVNSAEIPSRNALTMFFIWDWHDSSDDPSSTFPISSSTEPSSSATHKLKQIKDYWWTVFETTNCRLHLAYILFCDASTAGPNGTNCLLGVIAYPFLIYSLNSMLLSWHIPLFSASLTALKFVLFPNAPLVSSPSSQYSL